MNCGLIADFVPLSVYIGFPMFVFAKDPSGQMLTILWRARGTVGFWDTPTRRHFVLPGPAAPRRSAVRRADPNRPWYVRVLDSTDFACSCSCKDVQNTCLRCLECMRDACIPGDLSVGVSSCPIPPRRPNVRFDLLRRGMSGFRNCRKQKHRVPKSEL